MDSPHSPIPSSADRGPRLEADQAEKPPGIFSLAQLHGHSWSRHINRMFACHGRDFVNIINQISQAHMAHNKALFLGKIRSFTCEFCYNNIKNCKIHWAGQQVCSRFYTPSYGKTEHFFQSTGHSKHPLPTIQEKTLHMDITRWSIPKSY